VEGDNATKDLTDPSGGALAPNAVLDTNVMLSIYSWHDLVEVMERVGKIDPRATLHRPDVQFRAQRLRWGFLLSLFLDEKGWATICPFEEFTRKMEDKVNPNKAEHDTRVGYTTLYAHFIKDLILTGWKAGADTEDHALVGDDVDVHCAKRAETFSVPLISWEGVSHTGEIDNDKTIRKEALQRGVVVVTPQELLVRERFDPRPAIERFFRAWVTAESAFLEGHSGHAAANVAFMKGVFLRLARNDWDP